MANSLGDSNTDSKINTNITNFLNKFPIGFARPNRYMVEMSLPEGISEQGSWINSESTTSNIGKNNKMMNRTRTSSNCLPYLYYAGANFNDISAFTALCPI